MFKKYITALVLMTVTCIPVVVSAKDTTEQEKYDCIEAVNTQTTLESYDLIETEAVQKYGLDHTEWPVNKDHSNPVKAVDAKESTLLHMRKRTQAAIETCEKFNYSLAAIKVDEAKAKSLGIKLLVEYFSTSSDTVMKMYEEMLRFAAAEKYDEIFADLKVRLDLLTKMDANATVRYVNKSKISVVTQKDVTGTRVYYIRVPMAVDYSFVGSSTNNSETFTAGVWLTENKAAANDYGLSVLKIGKANEIRVD